MRNRSLKNLQKQGREENEFISRNIVFVVVAGRMFKRRFPFTSLNLQSTGKEIYVSKSSENI